MLKILHTEASTGWGGQEIRILQECMGMAHRGHRTIIAAQEQSNLRARALKAGIPVFPERFSKGSPFAILKMSRLIEREEVDIVNTHSSSDSWVAALASRLSGRKPIIIRTRHVSVPISRSLSSRLIYDMLPHAVITTGEDIRQRMMTANGFDGAKIVSIPTGVDLQRFDPKRVTPHFGKKGFIVGAISVLRRWKGHEYLVRAVPQILAAVPDALFLIVGDGPQFRNLETLIGELSLGDKVMMLGHMEQIPEIISSLDVLVHPSYANEGVPQSILQAFAMKKPVVASDAGAIKEVVLDNETGYLIHPKNASEIAEKVIELYRNPELGTRFGNEGRWLVEKTWSLDRMLDRLDQLYGRLLHERK